MGNSIYKYYQIPISFPNPKFPCIKLALLLTKSNPNPAKLILWEGTTRLIPTRKHQKKFAGEIMFEYPHCLVCHADSFFLGRPVPSLNISDELLPGHTYFVLPIDRLSPNTTLSAASLSALGSPSSSPNRAPIKFGDHGSGPFEYIRGSSGGVLIKVTPKFIMSLITNGENSNDDSNNNNSGSSICSTPELRKQYEQLVRAKEQGWSPKLEPISEYKVRYSPCRFIGIQLKQREK